MPKIFCIMQIRAMSQNLTHNPHNYWWILYQFFVFTQNLKQSRIFCKTPIRQHSCTTHCVQTVPVLAAILQKILWNSIILYIYLFYVFMNTWRHSLIKLRIFKRKGVYVKRYWFSIFVVVDRCLLYSKISR